MAAEEERSDDFYAVLGLEKECSEAELRNAYKKLALKWHPDRCSASGNKKHTVEAKEKFQEIQEAYSVLSDSNKRFLYDFGVYDKEDENDEQGMGVFIGQMVQMMSPVKRSGSDHESFEELQGLFVELFRDDLDAGLCGRDRFSSASVSSSASSPGAGSGSGPSHKRSNSAVDDSGKGKLGEFDSASVAFSFGSNDAGQTSEVRGSNGKRRNRSRRHHPSMTTPDDN